MKKNLIFALVLSVFILTGCAAIKHMVSNAKECLSDQVCTEEGRKKRDEGQRVGNLFGGLIPVPAAAPIAGSVLGGIYLLVYLVKDKKKK